MFNVYSTKSAMSASGSNVHKLVRVANFCTRVIQNEHILGTVVFQRVDKFKVYTLNKLKIINFFLHDIIEWLRVLIKKSFVKLGLKCSNFQPLLYQVRFARIGRSNQRYENPVFCRNYLVHCFGESKMYTAALHKIPTQTVDSSQFLAKCIRQKQPQIITGITKNWDKNKKT